MYTLPCDCGKEHKAPIDAVIIENGAINQLPKVLAPYQSIFLVADDITYKIAGEKAKQLLEDHGHHVDVYVLKNPVLPDPATVGHLLLELPPCDYILAVGSGTINDTCRALSSKLGKPYGVVGTAPSMDGYASNISPMVMNNTKQIVFGTTPLHIIADIDIMKHAPYEMLLAGIGDMVGKYIAQLDWKLANIVTGEYYCAKVSELILTAADKCLATANTIKERSNETIKSLAEGLILSGLGMAYTGVSRPASGAEHMIGHTWEIESIKAGEFPKLHGLEVAQGTLVCTRFYLKLYQETCDEAIKELIKPYLPRLQMLPSIYEIAGILPVTTGRARFLYGLVNGRLFRDRYTILTYLYNNNLLESYIDEEMGLFDQK